MKGAIIGDIVGSVYEFDNTNRKDFPLFSEDCDFTDDTVMTCAVAEALMNPDKNTAHVMQSLAREYPDAGYGSSFIEWVFSKDPKPYGSYGNGSAMRISPVGFLAKSEEEVKSLTKKVTEVSHNHPEGIKGAECTAMCIFLARQGKTKEEILQRVERDYYSLDKTCADYRREQNLHHGREICQVSVPQAVECFKESADFTDCIRNCISIGGDSDTIAAIAGGIAEAYYGIPEPVWEEAKKYLSKRLEKIVENFYSFVG